MEAEPNDVTEPSEPGGAPAAPPPAVASPDGNQPVVIVQYRPIRWWSTLLPPALFVLLACAILSYRVWAPDWLGWDPWAPLRQPTAPPVPPAIANHPRPKAPEPEPAPVPPLVPPQATIDVSPQPPAAPAVSAAEAPGKLSVTIHLSPEGGSPADVPPVVPVERRPAPPGPEAAAVAPPAAPIAGPVEPGNPPKAAEVLADIAQEAREKHAERAELEGLKAELLDHQTLADRARDHDARRAFHVELRKALQQVGHVEETIVAGRIHALADQSGEPGVGARGARNPVVPVGARAEGIRGLRRSGMAEREILRLLEEGHSRNRVSRSGPRTEAEATIRAARDLLAAALEPVPASNGAGAKGSSPALKFPISSRRR